MANKYTTPKKVIDKDAELLAEIIGKFDSARKYYQKGYKDTWANARKLYNSQRIAVNYAGSSDTFVPETFSIIQTVKSNVMGGKIKTEFFLIQIKQRCCYLLQYLCFIL